MGLTGGLDPAVDFPITDPAVDSSAGENHAFWVFDDAGEYAVLNCHLQAGGTEGYTATTAGGKPLSEKWDWLTRRESFSFALPGERLLVDWAVGSRTTPEGPGAAGWAFRCEEPFTRWTGSYRGNPRATTPAESQAGLIDLAAGSRPEVECDLEMTMCVPPWVNGSFAEDLPGRAQGLRFQGIPRYEQLYRASVRLQVDGHEQRFTGTGLRTHRYGPRDVTGIAGHSWLTAVFPSGRAFGVMRFPRPDGGVLFSEGFVTGPDGLTGARVLDSPWLTSLEYAGEKFAVELATAEGQQRIDGEVLASAYMMGLGVSPDPADWVITHGMARFTWDAEETCGLIERSAPSGSLPRPAA